METRMARAEEASARMATVALEAPLVVATQVVQESMFAAAGYMLHPSASPVALIALAEQLGKEGAKVTPLLRIGGRGGVRRGVRFSRAGGSGVRASVRSRARTQWRRRAGRQGTSMRWCSSWSSAAGGGGEGEANVAQERGGGGEGGPLLRTHHKASGGGGKGPPHANGQAGSASGDRAVVHNGNVA